jgi:hypothetical protein
LGALARENRVVSDLKFTLMEDHAEAVWKFAEWPRLRENRDFPRRREDRSSTLTFLEQQSSVASRAMIFYRLAEPQKKVGRFDAAEITPLAKT